MENQPDVVMQLQSGLNAGLMAEIVKPFEIAGTPCVIVPQGFKLERFEHMRERPVDLQKTVSTQSVESFIEYFNRFADQNSTIFVDYEKQRILGVLDYHESDDYPGQRWCRHAVVYDFVLTPEAEKWVNSDKKAMDQTTFASFIEDGLPEIHAPTPALMLEIATTLQAKTGVDFRSHIRLENGQVQFQYNETIQGSAGVTGQLQIPVKLQLGIQLFRGSQRYAVDANFRYRLNGGKITMWYELIRFHVVRDDAIKAVMQQMRENIASDCQILEANT